MVIGLIIFSVILLLVMVAVLSSETITKQSESDEVVEFLKSCRESSARYSEQRFQDLKKLHSSKNLDEIEEYIKSHQQNNDPYWEHNRMEYKVLMDRIREIQKLKIPGE